jgi:hypothetical protein
MKTIFHIIFFLLAMGGIQAGEGPSPTFMEISLKPLQTGRTSPSHTAALVCCATVKAGQVTKLSLWSPTEDCGPLKVCASWRGLATIHLHLNAKINFAGFVDTIRDFEDLRELILTDSDDAPAMPWQKLQETTKVKSLVLVPGAHARQWLTDLAALPALGALDSLTIHYSSENATVLEQFDFNSIKWIKNLNLVGAGQASLPAVKLLATKLKQTTLGVAVKSGADPGSLE